MGSTESCGGWNRGVHTAREWAYKGNPKPL